MYLHVQVCLILYTTTFAFSNGTSNQDLLLRLDPNEIVDTFKTVISSRYIREMANQMANKAAIHFINKIKTKEKMKQIRMNKKSGLQKRKGPPLPIKEEFPLQVHAAGSTSPPPQPQLLPAFHPYREAEKKVPLHVNQQNGPRQKLNQHQDMKPKPNSGHDKSVLDENVAFALLKDPSPDGDDWELESLELSEIRNEVPVVAVKKINGVYFRRLLDSILS